MKAHFLFLVLFSGLLAFAQEGEGDLNLLPDLYEGDSKLSVKGGFLSIRDKVESPAGTETESSAGYYLGIAYNFNFSKNFDFQPELVWANGKDGRDAFLLPFLASIRLTEELSLQAGPQFAFLLQEQPENISGFRVQLATGLRYDFDGGIYADLRYAPQFSNSFDGEGDVTIRAHYLTLGMGINLN